MKMTIYLFNSTSRLYFLTKDLLVQFQSRWRSSGQKTYINISLQIIDSDSAGSKKYFCL